MKEWKDCDMDDCPECGGSILVFTAAPDGKCFDGDAVKCMDCEFRSAMNVDEDGRVWVQDD